MEVIVRSAANDAEDWQVPAVCRNVLNMTFPSIILDTSGYECAYGSYVGGSGSTTLK